MQPIKASSDALKRPLSAPRLNQRTLEIRNPHAVTRLKWNPPQAPAIKERVSTKGLIAHTPKEIYQEVLNDLETLKTIWAPAGTDTRIPLSSYQALVKALFELKHYPKHPQFMGSQSVLPFTPRSVSGVKLQDVLVWPTSPDKPAFVRLSYGAKSFELIFCKDQGQVIYRGEPEPSYLSQQDIHALVALSGHLKKISTRKAHLENWQLLLEKAINDPNLRV